MNSEDFQFRCLDSRTREQYLDLCQYCFGMSREARDHYCVEPDELADSLGAFAGDRLAAGMRYYAFAMRVRTDFIPMAGVAAVATWPEFRNRGLVRALLTRMQEKMRTEGRPLSILMPFKYSYYYDMGWATTFEYQEAVFEPLKIRAFPDEGYTVRAVNGPDEWETFEDLSIRFGAVYNGPVRRSERYWARRYFESPDRKKRNSYLVERGGEARGFLLGRLTDAGPGAYDKEYSVLQSVWLDAPAQRAIFTFLRSHRDQVKRIRLYLPPQTRLLHLFDDPQFELKLKPKMMAKLVDVPAALEALTFDSTLDGSITLAVEGESTAPWNSNSFTVSFHDGRATVTTGKPGADALHLRVQNLGELYLGYRTVGELVAAGEVTGPNAQLERLDAAFPRYPTYIDDWF